jgi:hypothetical protein
MADYYFKEVDSYGIEGINALWSIRKTDPFIEQALRNVLQDDYNSWVAEVKPDRADAFDDYMDDMQWSESGMADSDIIDLFIPEIIKLNGWKGCAFDWDMDGDYFMINIYQIIPQDVESLEELIFNYVHSINPSGLEEIVVEHIMEEINGKS